MATAPRGYDVFSTLSPQQLQILEQLLPQLLGSLGGEGADKFAAPFQRQFEEKTVPGLAERFAGLGAGSQSSSAFQQALGQAGAGLSENLASLGAQREQSSIGNLLNLLSQNTQGLIPKSKPWWQEGLIGLSSGLGQGLGAGLTGGPASGISSLLGSLFGNKQDSFSSGQQGSYINRDTGALSGGIF